MTYDMNKMDAINEKLDLISADLKRLLQAQPDHIKVEIKPIAVDSLETKSRAHDGPTECLAEKEYPTSESIKRNAARNVVLLDREMIADLDEVIDWVRDERASRDQARKGRVYAQAEEPSSDQISRHDLWIDTGGYYNIPLRWDGRKWQMVSRS